MIAATRSIYLGRKRKRGGQNNNNNNNNSAETLPGNGLRSNPSKRHRDRLNTEFNNLLRLLPTSEDVADRLDKLSILRLSVSYLRLKRFFEVSLRNGKTWASVEPPGEKKVSVSDTAQLLRESDLLLQVLNGFIIVVVGDGCIFYASATIQEYLGFHQTAVMHQPVYDLIHPEDRIEFRRQLHWALNPSPLNNCQPSRGAGGQAESPVSFEPRHLPPENSAFLERSFVCRMRSLLDTASGFVPLNLQGRLKYLHGQNKRGEDGSLLPPQLALFAVATPLELPSILEIRTKSGLFHTRHKLDFTPVGCDTKAKMVLGYTEMELCMRGSGYQFVHAADMLYCADMHVRLMKTGETGLTIFRLLTKWNEWVWVQSNARLVYKNGKPDSIIAKQRLLTEREGADHFAKRSLAFPLTFTNADAALYGTSSPLTSFANPHPLGADKLEQSERLDPNSLLGVVMSQDESVYISHLAPRQPRLTLDRTAGAGVGLWAGGDGLEGLPHGEAEEEEISTNCKQEEDLLSILDEVLKTDLGEGDKEIPSVLEGLGPEDLELMQWVERTLTMEMDAGFPLNDLLTNDQVLSYVQSSLVSRERPATDHHHPGGGLCPLAVVGSPLSESGWRVGGGKLAPAPALTPPPLPRPCFAAQAAPSPPCEHQRSRRQREVARQHQHQRLPLHSGCPWASQEPLRHPCMQEQELQRMQQQQQQHQAAAKANERLNGEVGVRFCGFQPHHPAPETLGPDTYPAPRNCRLQPPSDTPPFAGTLATVGPPAWGGGAPTPHGLHGLPKTLGRTDCLLGAQQNGGAFLVFGRPLAPHPPGHPASVLPSASPFLSRDYPHLRPSNREHWHSNDLYRMKEDLPGFLASHPTENGTHVLGNSFAQ
ncbi:aryl hydrocarbon receptor-like [Callorhinchus milii]|uniref:aryl hydrocarbon receptor-like n=1 Tax=Callorhinchus milii TaxID=7868 RepID=UPI001C3F5BDB|nr:aryl hydrocarbon receptor-like [Callorhinchus milii]